MNKANQYFEFKDQPMENDEKTNEVAQKKTIQNFLLSNCKFDDT